MTLDEAAKRKLIELLKVDDIEVVNGLAGVTVMVKLADRFLADTFPVEDIKSQQIAEYVAKRVFDLARRLRDSIDISTAIDNQLTRVASMYGMSRDVLGSPSDAMLRTAFGVKPLMDLPRDAFKAGYDVEDNVGVRCVQCGHGEKIHNRVESADICSLWGCACMQFVHPDPQPRRPANRFEAVAEELKKL